MPKPWKTLKHKDDTRERRARIAQRVQAALRERDAAESRTAREEETLPKEPQ